MSRVFGLIGYPLSHSFSKNYFAEKFRNEKISDAAYQNFPLENISSFPELVNSNPDLRGLNVTIPHKKSIIKFLDEISPEAKETGAVNCIKIASGKLKGYNTDYIGFLRSLKKYLQPHHAHALILGTGGSSKAVQFALKMLNIKMQFVSRTKTTTALSYAEMNKEIIEQHTLIINTTPLGMASSGRTTPSRPTATASSGGSAGEIYPDIPYRHVSSKHLLFDLIYNPAETLFLQKGKAHGATIVNGLEMLQIQAEESWKIWNGF
jgi:shikimate dehydrogenase